MTGVSGVTVAIQTSFTELAVLLLFQSMFDAPARKIIDPKTLNPFAFGFHDFSNFHTRIFLVDTVCLRI